MNHAPSYRIRPIRALFPTRLRRYMVQVIRACLGLSLCCCGTTDEITAGEITGVCAWTQVDRSAVIATRQDNAQDNSQSAPPVQVTLLLRDGSLLRNILILEQGLDGFKVQDGPAIGWAEIAQILAEAQLEGNDALRDRITQLQKRLAEIGPMAHRLEYRLARHDFVTASQVAKSLIGKCENSLNQLRLKCQLALCLGALEESNYEDAAKAWISLVTTARGSRYQESVETLAAEFNLRCDIDVGVCRQILPLFFDRAAAQRVLRELAGEAYASQPDGVKSYWLALALAADDPALAREVLESLPSTVESGKAGNVDTKQTESELNEIERNSHLAFMTSLREWMARQVALYESLEELEKSAARLQELEQDAVLANSEHAELIAGIKSLASPALPDRPTFRQSEQESSNAGNQELAPRNKNSWPELKLVAEFQVAVFELERTRLLALFGTDGQSSPPNAMADPPLKLGQSEDDGAASAIAPLPAGSSEFDRQILELLDIARRSRRDSPELTAAHEVSAASLYVIWRALETLDRGAEADLLKQEVVHAYANSWHARRMMVPESVQEK